MSKVSVTKDKLDILANAIANKSGEPLTLTLDEMVEAVDGIETGGGTPTLETVTKTYIPSTSAVTDTITPSTGYDGIEEVDVTVSAVPTGERGIPSWSKSKASTTYVLMATFPNVTAGYISSIPAISTTLSLENKAVEPTENQQTVEPTDIGCYLNSVTVNAIPSNYVGSGITQRSSTDLTVSGATVTAPSGYYSASASKSVASGNQGSPSWSTSKGATTFAVAVSYPNATEGYYRSIDTGSYSMLLEDKTATPSTSQQVITPTSNVHYLNSVTVNAMPTGSAGTPTATKGTVSNHSVSVTPSVTNTTGYITGSTKTGTAVTVSASELVSGSETKTENGTYDVTNLAEIVVNVQGGGSSGITVATSTASVSIDSSIQFTGLQGAPTSFAITSVDDISTNSVSNIADIIFDGSTFHGQGISTEAGYLSSGAFTPTYNNGVLQVYASGAQFVVGNTYKLVYTYGGSTSDIHTSDIQVGSGATSITFPVSGRPIYWSCIFKSSFSTSQGYQRVIAATNDGTNIYGMCLDSSGHASNTYWSANYSGGNLVISSQSTNAGGYFHQPGYYQLTYAIDESAPSYQTKTVTPTTSQQVITADSGYDALSQVTVNAIPNTYVQPTATRGATTYTPSTTNQTIAAGTYLTGAQTITGDADLVASNIVSGVQIFGVTGNVVLQNYYTGSSAPSSSTGSNGDLYLQS